MAFTYTQQKNIIGRTRSYVGDLGAEIANGLAEGRKMDFEECKLSYVLHVMDTLCRFIPVGEEVDDHVQTEEDNNITQDEADSLLNQLLIYYPCT